MSVDLCVVSVVMCLFTRCFYVGGRQCWGGYRQVVGRAFTSNSSFSFSSRATRLHAGGMLLLRRYHNNAASDSPRAQPPLPLFECNGTTLVWYTSLTTQSPHRSTPTQSGGLLPLVPRAPPLAPGGSSWATSTTGHAPTPLGDVRGGLSLSLPVRWMTCQNHKIQKQHILTTIVFNAIKQITTNQCKIDYTHVI